MGKQYGHDEWQKKDAGAVPQEIKTAIATMMRDWETFKQKNDAEMAALKRKGSSDVITRDELARVNTAIDKAKDDINSLFKKASRPAFALPAAEQAIQTKANGEFATWIGHDDPVKAGVQRIAYKRAFDKLIRRGEKALDAEETKALSVGSAPDGGFYVEPQRADYIVQRLRETSDMRGIASVMTISATSLKIPIDRDDVGFEWVGEQSGSVATCTTR